ncbi:MAG: hypothetical protein JXO22_14935 [Phycisphaerae bacterium]|nr:hypothetical protein [Phycisphaerae bacterium]
MAEYSLDAFVNRRVVLDTQGPLLYIGELRRHDERGYWLADADVHDRGEGHASKELYVNDARAMDRSGARRVNRRLVFVDRMAVTSVSLLDDVVTDDTAGEESPWLPDDQQR